MDRFAEKYYSLSPYQYAGNNPIRNIDVNGDSIVIEANPNGLFDQIKDWLGFDTQYQSKVKEMLEELKEIDEDVKEMIERLEASEHIIRITQISKERRLNGENGNIARPETEEEGVKQGGTIEFDPYNTKTSEGYRSPIIGLVHELAHTDDFIQGRMVPVDGKKLKQKDEFELLNKRIAEQYPLEMENKVRAKLKLPLRSSTFIFK